MEATNETCSRCEEALDTTGYPKWCKKCRAAHKREYNRLQKEMTETRGFAAGASAARELYVREFETKVGRAMISGHEAARLLRICKGPHSSEA